MKRKLPEKFFEQNQRAKTRKWKFFNLNQALWGAGNRESRKKPDDCLVNPVFLHDAKPLKMPPDASAFSPAFPLSAERA